MCAFAFDEFTGTLSPKPVSVARVASPNYVFAAPMNEALAGSISARRTHRENSVMSMQTQQIVVEDAVAGDAESAPASAIAAVAA